MYKSTRWDGITRTGKGGKIAMTDLKAFVAKKQTQSGTETG